MADLAKQVRAAVAAADVEQLRVTLALVLEELHGEHEVRNPAGRLRYSICRCCCMDDDDNQSPTCRDHHDHFGLPADRCYPCTTWHVAARGLRVPG